MANANRILLKGDPPYDEDIASEAITPGHLIEVHTSTGRKVRKHSVSGGYAERAFALEDALQGAEIDTAYASGARVPYILAQPGDEVQAWLKVGETVVIGDQLISAGDGTLIKETGTPEQVVGIATEAVDLSGSGAVVTRIDIRVL